jgi:hypothetical protein
MKVKDRPVLGDQKHVTIEVLQVQIHNPAYIGTIRGSQNIPLKLIMVSE